MTEHPSPTGQGPRSPDVHESDVPPPYSGVRLGRTPEPTVPRTVVERDYPPMDPGPHFVHEPLHAGTAIDYGWQTVKSNLGAWLGAAALALVAYAVFVVGTWALSPTSIVAVSLLMFAMFAASALGWACFLRGALYELDGRRPVTGSFFQQIPIGPVLATAALVAALTLAGFVLLVVPAVIVAFGSMFAPHFVIDYHMSPARAINMSWRLVSAAPLEMMLLALMNAVLLLFGVLTFGLGLFITLPIVAVSTAYAYRTLTNGTVSPMWTGRPV